MRRALTTLNGIDIEPLVAHYALNYPKVRNAAGILRSSLVHRIAGRALDAFHVDLWARNVGLEELTFVGCSEWDKILLSDPKRGRKVVGTVVRKLDRFWLLSNCLPMWFVCGKHRPTSTPQVHEEPLYRHSSLGEGNADSSRTVLYVLNLGASYAGLYLYDHIFSDDEASPLHRHNVVMMGRTGGSENSQGIRHGFPSHGSRVRKLLRAVGLSVKALWKFGRRFQFSYVWALSKTCAAVEGQQISLLREFPSLKLAILAYDMQVPVDMVLALESLGIITVALNERPQSVVWEMQPFAVSTLLTASEVFSAMAEESRSVSVDEGISVGMWRTDLLCKYRSEDPHQLRIRALENGQRFIVALPLHVTARSDWDGSPLGTSALSVRHFLWDVLRIAEENPKAFIVIRGKNDNWVPDDRFKDIVGKIDRLPNIVVSRDYSTFNESYRLCAWADLVLAKHTSLVDEVLSVGIPCVVHDYTPNSKDLSRLVVPYLPREIWAEDFNELRERIAFALANEGGDFDQWWEPHRERIYGNFNDGRVRERARSHIASMVGESQ
jgi:hypothetical protein